MPKNYTQANLVESPTYPIITHLQDQPLLPITIEGKTWSNVAENSPDTPSSSRDKERPNLIIGLSPILTQVYLKRSIKELDEETPKRKRIGRICADTQEEKSPQSNLQNRLRKTPRRNVGRIKSNLK